MKWTTQRRRGDPDSVDHRDERSIDWRTVAPRWLLVAMVFGGFSFGSFASMIAWNFYEAREADMERRYADWKGGAIADHEYRITTLERESKNGREDAARLDAAAKLTRLQTQMETVTENMRTLTAEVRRSLKEN